MKIGILKRFLYAWTVLFFILFNITFGSYKSEGLSKESLNIMSFNIRYWNPKDRENAWPNRKGMVAETIRFHKTDIAGLQEALDEQVNDLEALLPEYGWFGKGRDDGKRQGEYSPVFYRKSRFKILHQSTFWLSETPNKPGSIGWDAACPRIVTWGKMEDRVTHTRFYVFNTHFDHVGEKARIKSAEILLEKTTDLTENAPVILTGDLNCTEIEAPYKILTSTRDGSPAFSDAYHALNAKHYGSTQTFNGFTDEIRPNYRIDFILVRNITDIIRQGVISDKWDGKFVSDHFPVLAEIVMNKK